MNSFNLDELKALPEEERIEYFEEVQEMLDTLIIEPYESEKVEKSEWDSMKIQEKASFTSRMLSNGETFIYAKLLKNRMENTESPEEYIDWLDAYREKVEKFEPGKSINQMDKEDLEDIKPPEEFIPYQKVESNLPESDNNPVETLLENIFKPVYQEFKD